MCRIAVSNNLRAGRCDNSFVATRVIAVFMRVQNLRDRPALVFRNAQAFVEVERVDRKCIASLGTGDQVIKIAGGGRAGCRACPG